MEVVVLVVVLIGVDVVCVVEVCLIVDIVLF